MLLKISIYFNARNSILFFHKNYSIRKVKLQDKSKIPLGTVAYAWLWHEADFSLSFYNLLTNLRSRIIIFVSPYGGYEGGLVMEQHEHTKAVLNRIARAIGHLNAVKKMIEAGRDCSDVLIQLSAVKSEIANTSKVILKDHLDHCIVRAIRENDEETMQHLKAAIDQLL